MNGKPLRKTPARQCSLTSNRIRLTAACGFSCYGFQLAESRRGRGPLDLAQTRECVSFELDSAANK